MHQAEINNDPLAELLATAPPELVRRTQPLILEPDIISQASLPFLTEFKTSWLNGQTKVCQVETAKVLELALSQVKSHLDEYGTWALSLPFDFCQAVVGELVGRENSRPTDFWKPPNAAEIVFRKIRPWLSKLFQTLKDGSLYEFGLMTVGEQNHSVLASVSVPYEDRGMSYETWWKKLTFDNEARKFVGRETQLSQFASAAREVGSPQDITEPLDHRSIDLFGQPLETEKIASIYDQSDAQVWWGQTGVLNQVVSLYAPEARQRLSGPSFGQRIFAELQTANLDQLLDDYVVAPRFLTGYYIVRERTAVPGTFKTRLVVDDQNWADFHHFKSKGERSSAHISS